MCYRSKYSDIWSVEEGQTIRRVHVAFNDACLAITVTRLIKDLTDPKTEILLTNKCSIQPLRMHCSIEFRAGQMHHLGRLFPCA